MLPANLFALRGDAFYTLIKELTSEDVEELLKIQRISTARCFLGTNPLNVFNILSNDPTIVQLQKRLSFPVLNGGNIVLAGVEGDVFYLTKLLVAFDTNKKRKANAIHVVNNIQHPYRSQLTTTAQTAIPHVTAPLTITEHRNYLTQQIESWLEKHRTEYRIENVRFIEPDDYKIAINANSASVQCSCYRKINLPLPKDRDHYQLSNFYKHLTQNNQCTALERTRPMSESESDDDHADVSSSLYSTASSTPLRQTVATKKAKKNNQ